MSNHKLEAVLWDLDGVIADTGIYHYQAWVDVFGKLGKTFTEEHFMRHFGQMPPGALAGKSPPHWGQRF